MKWFLLLLVPNPEGATVYPFEEAESYEHCRVMRIWHSAAISKTNIELVCVSGKDEADAIDKASALQSPNTSGKGAE